jgi:VanZ family protein
LKSNSTSQILRYWLPAILWLSVIAIESFELSSNVTGGWLMHVLGWAHIHLSAPAFAEFHHILRKTGHLTGYGILCLLLFRAWFHTLLAARLGNLRSRCAALALSVTLLTAILDEWHQSFDPTRTSSPWDVGLDMCGAILFLCFALFVFRSWRQTPAEELETVSV